MKSGNTTTTLACIAKKYLRQSLLVLHSFCVYSLFIGRRKRSILWWLGWKGSSGWNHSYAMERRTRFQPRQGMPRSIEGVQCKGGKHIRDQRSWSLWTSTGGTILGLEWYGRRHCDCWSLDQGRCTFLIEWLVMYRFFWRDSNVCCHDSALASRNTNSFFRCLDPSFWIHFRCRFLWFDERRIANFHAHCLRSLELLGRRASKKAQ